MAENNEKPNLDDYRSMIHATHAPAHLQSSVLKQAGQMRAKQESARTHAVKNSHTPTRPKPTIRPHKHSSEKGLPTPANALLHAAHKRSFHSAAAVAACLVFAVALVATGSAIGWPGGATSNSNGPTPAIGNSFVLAAYAAENPEGTPGKTVLLDSTNFTGGGGHSGLWYNPADQTFWDYPWVGYKYRFSLECTGNNVASLTYEIEGERSYFETIDNEAIRRHQEGEQAFSYTKAVTFDYENQSSNTEERTVSLYIGYYLPDAGIQANSALHALGTSVEVRKQWDIATEVGAVQEISKSRLKLTAKFFDGSTQTKTFIIAPITNFNEVYSDFWDTREASRDETKGIPHPDKPKLYTITEVTEA